MAAPHCPQPPDDTPGGELDDALDEGPEPDVDALLARMDARATTPDAPTIPALVDCLEETWVVARIDRSLSADEERRLRSLLVGRPRVLEVFCGTTAMMWASVWRECAGAYTGVDQTATALEVRDVRIGDAMERLGELDLGQYDCFDVDAWGSPWRIVRAIAGRVRLTPGRRIGLVITDGSSQNQRFKGSEDSVHWAAPMPLTRNPWASVAAAVAALRAFGRLICGQQTWVRRAVSEGSGRGAQMMVYAAAVYEGRG